MKEEKKNLRERKKDFLKKLKGNSNKYKRYFGSPLRYGGGKTLAVGYILEHLPDDIDKVVSPFMGGGSVEIAIAKELGIDVIAYDIFDLLANYWKHQINNPHEMYEKLSRIGHTKDDYENIKNILKQHWNKYDGYDYKLDSLDAAVYYFYNMQLSFGPGFLGWMSSNYLKDNVYESTIKKVRDFDCKNIKVFTGRFEDSMPKHINDFMYLDPPYYCGGDSHMFKGIYPMRNFPIHHDNFNHELLCEYLHKHRGGFILSYNDCSWVRNAYKDFKIIEVKWQYTMGQGETRIGKNRLERDYDNTNVKSSHELIIIGEKYEN